MVDAWSGQARFGLVDFQEGMSVNGLLHRNQDSLLVAAAVSLVVLSWFHVPRLPAKTPEVATQLAIADPVNLAQRMRDIAADFYAANPVEGQTESDWPVTRASFETTATMASKSIASADAALRPGGWAVTASIAAGCSAGLAYQFFWPAGRAQSPRSRPADFTGNALRIELPGQWVRLRPSWRQRLGQAIVMASYPVAAIAAWGLFAAA